MIKKIGLNKLWLVAGFSLIFLMQSTNVFARGGGWSRSLPSRHEVVVVGHERYHYSGGRFYRPGWFGFGFFISAPPIGAVIRVLPFGYRTVIATGTPYYYYDNVYYRTCPQGYIVVPAPAANPGVVALPPVVTGTQIVSAETVTINVPNSNGGYTPVTLVKHRAGYVGPQGEYYPGNPAIEQLKVLYGR